MLKPEALTILIDTREQKPAVLKLSNDGRELSSRRCLLYSGDYSVKGLERQVAIERKSLPDLMGCIGRDRDRFERELVRLRGIPTRAIVVEAEWQDIEEGNYRSKVDPNAAIGSLMGWIASGVPVVMAGNAERAGVFIARMLYITARRRYNELKGLV